MNRFYTAALSHWESQKDEALATLELYFNKAVAIGEHSKILDEIHLWTHKLSEATENLESLKSHFDEYGDVNDSKPKKILND